MLDPLLVNERRKYTLVGILALVLWTSSLLFIKRCSEDLGPFTTAFLQFFSGGVIGLFANAFIFKKVGSSVTFFKNKEFYYRVALFSVYLDPSLSFPAEFILFGISIYSPLTFLISIPFLISLKLGYRWSQILLIIILLVYFLPGFLIVADFIDLFIKIPFFIIFLIILTAFRNRADLAAQVRDIRMKEYSKPIKMT